MLAGNGELSKLPLAWLERDYVAIDPFAGRGALGFPRRLGGADSCSSWQPSC